MPQFVVDRVSELGRQCRELSERRDYANKAYGLAVVDHLAAKIRAVCPDATYLAFERHREQQWYVVTGVLGAAPTPLSPNPWLWDAGDSSLRGFGEDIETDLQTALEITPSPVWPMSRLNTASEANVWLLELPPEDRITRITELVRTEHPEAFGLLVDGDATRRHVLAVDEGGSVRLLVGRSQLRWSREHDAALNAWVGQIFALPPLADRHLMPIPVRYLHYFVGKASKRMRLLPLNPTA
ncbi:hypothetical protein ACFCXR_15245 [Streptomyces noursei]|uniref:hypothetical protein n=1 Tax=Streptomyces noursei TaxID=1971 RepID=UPI00045F0C54|nr:hypothetical protein [Streptomyces noursei]AIA03426.1 hypothetical protein DC74_2926 [Streptomyces noursei]